MISRIRFLFLASSLALTALGCGGGDGGSNNRAACMAYVETVNDLPCVTGAAQLDPATACPATLDSTECDVSSYYDCVSEAYQCRDVGGVQTVDTTGVLSCTMPTCD